MNGIELQNAIDEAAQTGETVHVPPGIHEIDFPLIMRSGVRIVGSGERTVIRNIRTESPRAGETCVFLFGRYSDYHEAEDWYPCSYPARGDRIVVLDSGARILNDMQSGAIVFLKSLKTLGPKNPICQEMNQVVAVEDNVTHLLYPVSQDIDARHGGAHMAVSTGRITDRLGARMQIVCNAYVSDITLQMAGPSWSCIHFGGMWRCAFERVTFRGNQGIVGNGIARCRIQDCRFECDDKCLELAYFSHHTHVIGCEILQSEEKTHDVNAPLMLTGGGHHHIIERCNVVGKPARITACEGVRVLNNTFTVGENAPYAVKMNIGNGGLFSGNEMVVGSGTEYGAIISSRPGVVVRNNVTRMGEQIEVSSMISMSVGSGIHIDEGSIGAIVDGNVRLA